MNSWLNAKALRVTLSLLVFCLVGTAAWAQNTSNHGNKFEQLGTILPDPNGYRGADGAPGPDYWQQRADYNIECTLDTENQRLDGSELITYYNQSPNTLRYLWLQLDENEHSPISDANYQDGSSINQYMSESQLDNLNKKELLQKYGCNITKVTDANDNELEYMINQTVMRVNLPEPLKPGEQFSFKVDWYYYLIDRVDGPDGGRGGYEYFKDDGNYLYTITQWYPRMCVYSDFEGWQNKQFTGRGEFALTFGNFVVKMTLPDDHMVGATGECLNYKDVLTSTQYERWQKARNTEEPFEIQTLEEAKKMEKARPSENMQTWIYTAENVRDFAWTASRKFVWDAMPHITEEGKKVMCMSYYPKESYPIYRKYSTKAVEHTLATYSKYSIPYPYPTAISVEAANGMEYPMICFNPGRAEEDGTYTEEAKNSAILVIIHEVGHNYFPMIINNDERQWAWMDEGINSFIQYLTEQEWDNNFPSRWGSAHTIAPYMGQDKDRLEPIMTNSENIIDYGSNAYSKPATALNILRETIMGRELFDFAFKEYCRRWAFKHPEPADFFRSMEDASGVDLDWFWRGWFYGIDAVDISLDSVVWYKVDMENDPESQERSFTYKVEKPFDDISKIRNRESGMQFKVEEDKELQDFYTNYKPWETEDSVQTNTMIYFDETFSKKEKQKYADKNFYELHFSNKGGLVMPVILEWTFEDGTTEMERVPVEVWRKNENSFTKVFVKNKVVTSVTLDPDKVTADVDESNNSWPQVAPQPSRFQIFKSHKMKEKLNPMQKAQGKKIKP
jgi:hypothetical protein